MSHSLRSLTEEVENFRNARNWKQFHTSKDMLISLQLEVAELMEHFQWVSDSQVAELLKEKKSEIADELSDILYWVLLISKDLQVDLEASFLQKMKRNEAKYPVEEFKDSAKKYNQP